MQFEWDEHKDRINQTRHDGIDFGVAALAFSDPYLMLRKDRLVDGEQRWHAIGAAGRAVLLVVHVYREARQDGEEIIRIISARAANSRERRIYLRQTAQ